MERLKSLCIVLLSLLVLVPSAYAKSGRVLLQEGLYAEQTEGDLEKAIELYGQVLSEYKEVERIASRATYQLGMCYLKKGDDDKAAKYFTEVVEYYPEQKSAVRKAEKQLEKLGAGMISEASLWGIMGDTISGYIGSKYGEICAEAGMKRLYSNSHIYLVDSELVLHGGGMGYIYNWTGQPITERYRISGTTQSAYKLYSIEGHRMDIDIEVDEGRKGFYHVYWNPKEPLGIGEVFNYGWITEGTTKLSNSNAGSSYPITMQNMFGDHAYETFFLVVPEGMVLESQSVEYTKMKNLEGWDIYWWKKEVPANTNHVVDVTLKEADEKVNNILPSVAPSDNLLLLLPTEAYQHIFEQHSDAGKKASELGISNNTHIYGIDEGFIKNRGGLIDVFNMSQDTWTQPRKIAQFTCNNTNLELYDDNAERQQFEWKEVDLVYGTYCQLIWTPDRAVKPGEFRVLGYIHNELTRLQETTKGRQLVMQNDFGSEVIESFFLILPTKLKIIKNSSEITSHRRIGYFDIYEFRRHMKGNKNEITVILDKLKEYPETAKPVVIDSFPKTYSNDVDPDINEVTVTFDQAMFQHGWSWVRSGPTEIFPEIIGNIKYIDSRTCRMGVKVKPGKPYLVKINSPQYRSFRNTDDIPAAEFVIVFATKDADGNPTEIPAEMLEKARAINERNAIPKPVLDIVPGAVRTYISEHFRQTDIAAEEKGLRTNSHVHIIDEDFNRNFGLVQIYKNRTGKVVDHEVTMGSNDSPENYIYDDKGVRQKIRTRKIPGSNYRYFWTPSEPVAPGETRMLFYSTGTRKLSVGENQKASLRMQNHYGFAVIENFYLVLPANLEIDSQSEPFTSHETIEGFDIYCWSKEQGRNVQHRVEIKLGKRD